MGWVVEWTPRTRLVAEAVVLAATTAVVWHGVLAPMQAGNVRLRHRIDEASTSRGRKEATARPLALRVLGVSALDGLATYYRARLERGASPALLLATLTDIAPLERVEIVHFKPRAAIDRVSHLETPVDLTVEGNYHDVARLIDAVVTPPALAMLSDIKVSAPPRPGGRGSVLASVVASIFTDVSADGAAPSPEADVGEHDGVELEALRYDDGGRRDPFGSLIAPARAAGTPPVMARTGLAAVKTEEVVVKGIVRHGTEMLAILETATRQSFVVRQKDRLSDSSVILIDGDGVVFARAGSEGGTPRVKKPLFRPVRER